jgi:uncharacterized Zn-binding protein involved in type VI secretion
MANVVLNGDMSKGHNGWNAVPIHASSSVTINGVPIALDGDSYDTHTNSSGVTHYPKGIASGVATINGKKIMLAGDSLSCGDIATASSSVSLA